MTRPIPLLDPVSAEALPPSLYAYVWRGSARHQAALSLLSVVVFAMSMAPLELQRRIVNDVIKGGAAKVASGHLDAVRDGALDTLLLLCGLYAAAAVFMGAVKLALNVYRGWVGERATFDLRRRVHAMMPLLYGAMVVDDGGAADRAVAAEGTEISMVVAEVEPVGGFVGISVSEPLLQGGIFVTVVGYMLFLQPLMALTCLALFMPQLGFVPVLQRAINRRAAARIQVMREVSAGLIEDGKHALLPRGQVLFQQRAREIFRLNMQIFRRKFFMNFLMNATYHLNVIGILLVGGWFVLTGRTELGTVVAFLSGLAQLNDPWGDLVNYFRESTTAQVKYRLIAGALDRTAVLPA